MRPNHQFAPMFFAGILESLSDFIPWNNFTAFKCVNMSGFVICLPNSDVLTVFITPIAFNADTIGKQFNGQSN